MPKPKSEKLAVSSAELTTPESALHRQVREILDGARSRVARSINVQMTRAYEDMAIEIPAVLSDWSDLPPER